MQSATLGLALLERGELGQASTAVEGVALPIGGPTGIPLLEARGADLRHCGRLADDIQAMPNLHTWRSTLALALASEDPQEALALAKAELELARHAGAPRAIGIALRVCGLLADGPCSIKLLEESVAVLEPTPMRLELAYSLTELRSGRPDPQRTTGNLARCPSHGQPRHRPSTVHHHQNRQRPPLQRLPQTQHLLSRSTHCRHDSPHIALDPNLIDRSPIEVWFSLVTAFPTYRFPVDVRSCRCTAPVSPGSTLVLSLAGHTTLVPRPTGKPAREHASSGWGEVPLVGS